MEDILRRGKVWNARRSAPADVSHTVHTELKFTQAHVLCRRSSCRLYFAITDKTLNPPRGQNWELVGD